MTERVCLCVVPPLFTAMYVQYSRPENFAYRSVDLMKVWVSGVTFSLLCCVHPLWTHTHTHTEFILLISSCSDFSKPTGHFTGSLSLDEGGQTCGVVKEKIYIN